MMPFAPRNVSFYVVADTHFYAPSLGASGTAYDGYMRREQMCLAENSAIVHAVFDAIIEDKETDTVILPGDLVKDGERESHRCFIRELERLRSAGKRVFVLTARHDFNDAPHAYVGGERIPVEGTSREELRELYAPFGFSDAERLDAESTSYTARLAPGIILLMLNCDGVPDGSTRGGFDARLIRWISDRLDEARQNGDRVIAVNHYPFVPPAPVFGLVGDAKMRDWRNIAALLADGGVRLAFTGHMHIQSVNKFVSPAGNTFWDVCTSAPVGFPGIYRRVTLDGGTARVESLGIPPFDCDTGGLAPREYLARQFDSMIRNTISDALPAPARSIFNKITLGGVGRLLFIKIAPSLSRVKLADFACEIVMNIFAGDAPFISGTPEYEAVAKALRRLRPILKGIDKKIADSAETGLERAVLDSIGNHSGISDNDSALLIK